MCRRVLPVNANTPPDDHAAAVRAFRTRRRDFADAAARATAGLRGPSYGGGLPPSTSTLSRERRVNGAELFPADGANGRPTVRRKYAPLKSPRRGGAKDASARGHAAAGFVSVNARHGSAAVSSPRVPRRGTPSFRPPSHRPELRRDFRTRDREFRWPLIDKYLSSLRSRLRHSAAEHRPGTVRNCARVYSRVRFPCNTRFSSIGGEFAADGFARGSNSGRDIAHEDVKRIIRASSIAVFR